MKCKLLLLCTLLLSLSCDKEEDGNYLWYSYAETGCLDPWRAYPHRTNQELSGAVSRYLNEQGIAVHEVQTMTDSTLISFCKACFCTTGRVILVSADEQFTDSLLQIGFFRYKPTN